MGRFDLWVASSLLGFTLSFSVGCNEQRLGAAVPAPEPAPEDVFDTPDPGGGAATDTFVQGTRGGRVDILWVIDNSGSMAPEQELLGNNISLFIDEITGEYDIDYRMAITTQDVGDGQGDIGETENGAFVAAPGYPYVLTPDMGAANVIEAFNASARVGNDGYMESGLEAARRALHNVDYDQTTESWFENAHPQNEGFLRSDAVLAIFIISDARDTSWTWQTPYWFDGEDRYSAHPIRYIDDFLALKGNRARRLFFSVVIPPDSNDGCTAMRNNGFETARAAAENKSVLTNRTNLCDDNWTAALTDLGSSLRNTLDVSFPLADRPVVTTIKVFVDGQDVLSGPDSWVYDEVDNAVVFPSAYAPPEFAEISITYLKADPA